jgi:hypothetical protein
LRLCFAGNGSRCNRERMERSMRNRGNKYNFSRTNFFACSETMHYRGERNDFGYFSNVWRNKCDIFQMALFIKLWNLISCVCEKV